MRPVAGASKGKDWAISSSANVREVDAIVHVVRCFEDEDVIHNMGRVKDPVADAEVIMTELDLVDAESVASQLQKKRQKGTGYRTRMAAANVSPCSKKLTPHSGRGKTNAIPCVHG